MSRKYLVLLSLGLLGLVMASAYSQSPLATPSRTIIVEEGLVTLIDDNKVAAPEAGILMAIHVKEGNPVEKDMLLADIDNRETLAKKKIAEGELKAAEISANSDAEVQVALKAVDVAKAEIASNTEIRRADPRAISETEIRKFQFQLDRALAQVKQAEVEKLVAGQTAEVKRAQLDATAIDLDRRQLKALFKGQVVEIFKKPGDWVQPGDLVMRVMNLDHLRVKGFVLASQAAPSEVVGKPASVLIYGAGNKQHTLKGIVNFASPVIEGISASRQYRVTVDVENEKVTDPVTKVETWKIEPGDPAQITIDLNPPPPPRPVAPSKAGPGKTGASPPAAGTKTGTSGAGGESKTGTGGGSFYAPPAGKTIPASPAGTKIESLKPAVEADAGKKSRDR